jgi:uncharacterized protein YeaO (DUF488 family)
VQWPNRRKEAVTKLCARAQLIASATSDSRTTRERESDQHGRGNPVSRYEPGVSQKSDLFYTSHGIPFVPCSLRVVPVMKIVLKRAYEEPDDIDGYRVLVDRLWPRGKKKADLRLDMWAKDISPSTALRKWFGHDPARWIEFCKRYKTELTAPEMKDAISQVLNAAHKHSTMTLIYGAKDTEHNEAVVLASIFKRAATKAGKA